MSQPLPQLVSRFVDRFAASLEAAADPALQPFIDEIRGVAAVQASPIQDLCTDHPAARFLDAALGAQRAEERLCAAVRAIAPHLSFGSSYAGDGKLAALAESMVWSEIAGPNGVVKDPARRLGLVLLAPQLHYPLHGHVAEEIYFVLSGTLAVEHDFDGERVALAPGGRYRTPSRQAHALHSGDQPVLLVYCWIGDFSTPTWFHECDAAGRWQRTQPGVVRR
jgi:mannose-6-phosphate isomerase-like protein (cupin superfamily)